MTKPQQQASLSPATAPVVQGRGRLGAAFPHFPSTRFQGSKRRILRELERALSNIQFQTALDLYSGSGMVTLLLRHLGKSVDANDFQLFNQAIARLFIHGKTELFERTPYEKHLAELLQEAPAKSLALVTRHYSNIFFRDSENQQIDRICENLSSYSGTERDLYVYAVGQALLKKRPYNLFHRANLNMRDRDVTRTFGNAVTWETSIREHAVRAITELRKFPFGDGNPKGRVFGENTMDLSALPDDYDLVYLDPPYLNSRGIGVDYSDFYGFLEGLCQYDLFDRGDQEYPHKPINKKRSRWLRADTALEELSDVCRKWASSTLVLSYRSDGLPTQRRRAKC